MLKFLNSTPARVVTVLLLLQAGLLYSSIRPEFIPESAPLAGVPLVLGEWNFVQEGVIEQEVLDILQADDILNRTYQRGNLIAGLFVAGFKSQRNGKAPHSPKNCLPGSGWVPVTSGEIQVDVGREQPIPVNRYIVEYGERRSLVMYWYQSRDRAVASEYEAKLWVMADAIRYNRTDTALVRVVINFDKTGEGLDEAGAEEAAKNFVRAFYEPVRAHLPS